MKGEHCIHVRTVQALILSLMSNIELHDDYGWYDVPEGWHKKSIVTTDDLPRLIRYTRRQRLAILLGAWSHIRYGKRLYKVGLILRRCGEKLIELGSRTNDYMDKIVNKIPNDV